MFAKLSAAIESFTFPLHLTSQAKTIHFPQISRHSDSTNRALRNPLHHKLPDHILSTARHLCSCRLSDLVWPCSFILPFRELLARRKPRSQTLPQPAQRICHSLLTSGRLHLTSIFDPHRRSCLLEDFRTRQHDRYHHCANRVEYFSHLLLSLVVLGRQR